MNFTGYIRFKIYEIYSIWKRYHINDSTGASRHPGIRLYCTMSKYCNLKLAKMPKNAKKLQEKISKGVRNYVRAQTLDCTCSRRWFKKHNAEIRALRERSWVFILAHNRYILFGSGGFYRCWRKLVWGHILKDETRNHMRLLLLYSLVYVSSGLRKTGLTSTTFKPPWKLLERFEVSILTKKYIVFIVLFG